MAVGSPIDPEAAKNHNRTGNMLRDKRKSNHYKIYICIEPPVSEPNSVIKSNANNMHDHKFGESRDSIIGLEESLIAGTKMEINYRKHEIQKKQQEVNEKRDKIEEIQKRYDKNTKQKPQKRMTRGFSYQEQDRMKMGKAKSSTINVKKQPKDTEHQAPHTSKNASIAKNQHDAYMKRMGSETVTDKLGYNKNKKNMEEEIDEKLNTQTFRFTNQFKSEMDADIDFFNEEENDAKDMHDEYIAEEIESRSQESPRNNHISNLKKDLGPQEIPSDSNPFKRSQRQENSQEQIGTPINKPPKVPQRMSSKNAFQSPANQIFTTKRQRESQSKEK